MEYKIEKNIPIPRAKTCTVSLFPWEKMEIGDSFLIKCENNKKMINHKRSSVRSSISTFNKKHNANIKIITRNIDGNLRVWRTQ